MDPSLVEHAQMDTPLHFLSDLPGFTRRPEQELIRHLDIPKNVWDVMSDEQKELVLARRSGLIFNGEGPYKIRFWIGDARFSLVTGNYDGKPSSRKELVVTPCPQ